MSLACRQRSGIPWSAMAGERKLGPWTLLGELGSGGNATVYEAVSEQFTEPIALKVINTLKTQREPYQRFVREIQFLQGLEDRSGVLPLLDSNLPDKPSKETRLGWRCPSPVHSRRRSLRRIWRRS